MAVHEYFIPVAIQQDKIRSRQEEASPNQSMKSVLSLLYPEGAEKRNYITQALPKLSKIVGGSEMNLSDIMLEEV